MSRRSALGPHLWQNRSTQAESLPVRIEPGPGTLGAVVTDVCLPALQPGEWQAILAAFHRHAVLIFPAAGLTEAEHLAFSRRFGRLERTLSQRTPRPEISLLSNVDPASGAVAAPDDKLGLFLKGNRAWHTDSSFKVVPAKASLLRAIEVPAVGGDTEWADMRAAWDALPAADQQRLEGLRAVHSYAWSQGQQVGGPTILTPAEWDALPPVEHPLVRTHPATGRKSLFLGRHASHVVGMPEAKGRALLGELTAAACQPPRLFRHRWRDGDLALWDNRCVLHRGHPWPFEARRIMERATVAGDGENPWALDEPAPVPAGREPAAAAHHA